MKKTNLFPSVSATHQSSLRSGLTDPNDFLTRIKLLLTIGKGFFSTFMASRGQKDHLVST